MANPTVNSFSAFANYSSGFPRGVAIRGLPLVNLHRFTGKMIFVDSTIGSDNAAYSTRSTGQGTFNRPYATVAYALSAAVASSGDIIWVSPNHTETITAAAGWALSKAGVQVIGYAAENGDRPIITLSTAVTASIKFTAANCGIHGLILTPAIASLTNPVHVLAADCSVDVEWRDDTAGSYTPVSIILGTAAADDLKVNLTYRGKITSNNLTTPIQLVGTNKARIGVDFYGYASTSIVNFITTQCTDVHVSGRVNNRASVATVVDTIATSTWSSEVFNARSGLYEIGGDAKPITVAQEPGWNYFKVAALMTSVTWNTAAAHVIARTTGLVEFYLTPQVTVNLSTTSSPTLTLGDTTTATSLLGSSAAAGFTTTTPIWSATTPVSLYSGANALGCLHGIVSASNNILYTVGTAAFTSGNIDFHFYWRPLNATGALVAGDGAAS
jgi:hypothetical protein